MRSPGEIGFGREDVTRFVPVGVGAAWRDRNPLRLGQTCRRRFEIQEGVTAYSHGIAAPSGQPDDRQDAHDCICSLWGILATSKAVSPRIRVAQGSGDLARTG